MLTCILLRTAAVCTALFTMLTPTTPVTAAEPETPVYELRTYTTNEGKLPTLLTRFREHTLGLFVKHGITSVGYWVPVDPENGSANTLIFLLSHKDRATAKAAWEAFLSDPEWKAAAAASEANGKLLAKAPESIFLAKTAFSPDKLTSTAATPRTFELRTYTTNPGKLPNLHARFTNHTMGLFEKHGMTNICYWTPIDEAQGHDNKLIYILAHDSKEAGMKSFTAFRADPVWIAAKGESEKDGSLTVPMPEGVKSVYMAPTDFSPLK